jgi:hypothetical protein
METYKGRRVLALVETQRPKVAPDNLRTFEAIPAHERASIDRGEKRVMRERDAELVAAYLARKGKAVIKCKANPPKGQFLGVWKMPDGTCKRVYSPVVSGSINEPKAKAITTQHFSRG